MIKIGIIGGSGLEDPQILSNVHEEEVSTPYGKPTSLLKHGIINEKEVVLIDVRSKEEKARVANDYVFALIGGEKPTKFLESIGIKIG